jgi:hypothetical protein
MMIVGVKKSKVGGKNIEGSMNVVVHNTMSKSL